MNIKKKITPKNRKNYNITIGKEYEVLDELGTFFTIKNDKNIKVRYQKSLFEEVPVIPIERTDKEIIDSLEITFERDNDIVISLLKKERLIEEPAEGILFYKLSIISCGIGEVDHINDIMHRIVDSGITNQETINAIIEKIVMEIMVAKRINLLLISTNITDNEYFHKINNSLSEITDIETTTINDNSGNEIKLWVIEK